VSALTSKPAPWSWKNIAATGLAVSDIDFVLCTHLHVDHVGWNTRLENGRWVPTFPRAKYLFADRELDHWTRRQKEDPESCPWITDSVLPIVEAKRDERVKSDHVLDDLVKLLPTPGHTVDHYSVQVGKRGVDALITGDMVHSPLQLDHVPGSGVTDGVVAALSGKCREDQRAKAGKLMRGSSLIWLMVSRVM